MNAQKQMFVSLVAPYMIHQVDGNKFFGVILLANT